MKSAKWSFALVITASAAGLLMFSGCGKKQQTTSTSPSSPAAEAPKKESGDMWEDLNSKRMALTSYTMVMENEGKKLRQSAKFNKGKIERMKIDMGSQGWMLMQLDNKVQYIYNPQIKGAMKVPIKDSDMPSARASADINFKEVKSKNPAVTDDTVDGVDCYKIKIKDSSAWIDKEYGLPRQFEEKGKIHKIAYEKINGVPDSEFELPSGITVKEMADMMPK